MVCVCRAGFRAVSQVKVARPSVPEIVCFVPPKDTILNADIVGTDAKRLQQASHPIERDRLAIFPLAPRRRFDVRQRSG